MTLCAALRCWFAAANPQEFAAGAAFERADWAAICERVPRHLAIRRGNKLAIVKRTCDDALHTSGTGIVDRCRQTCSIGLDARHCEPVGTRYRPAPAAG